MVLAFAVVGAQWGDEAKGSTIDDIISLLEGKGANIRFQGGGNAGHTVLGKYFFHQLPSTIVRKDVFSFSDSGVLLSPIDLIGEIEYARENGFSVTPENYGISSTATITLDYHIEADKQPDDREHTSTAKGISPTAGDKYYRTGMKLATFLNADSMTERLYQLFPDGDVIFPSHSPVPNQPIERFVDYYEPARELLKPFMMLRSDVISDSKFDWISFEGAQGFGLDVDHGAYHGTSSSHPANPPSMVQFVIGVFKAYLSSVGIANRYFITQMTEKIDDKQLQDIIRDDVGEYGTTTHKPRRIGWFDAVYGRHAMKTTPLTHTVLSCLDKMEVFGKMGLPIKVAIAYEVNGRAYENWQAAFDNIPSVKDAIPIYHEMDSWSRTFIDGELNPKAHAYVDFLEEQLNMRFMMVRHGPDRGDNTLHSNPFKEVA
ncbi:adenylosuccinate synthetase [Candidatus Woesearchaeota archaeon]|nr:adenylosuccinate synthetase [Candidatus Woesearchaeota archaeon]